MMGTRKEMPKIPPHPPSFSKRKSWTPHESILSLSLVAWNFCFQNGLPPLRVGESYTKFLREDPSHS